jgi:RNA polymerase sigma factor (sigma-70 family)
LALDDKSLLRNKMAMSEDGAPTSGPESTADLLLRTRAGDADALEQLFDRLLPGLRRWARGRLPAFARAGQDTADFVQDAVLQAIRHLDRFEPRHEGALLAYLRAALSNRIRDEIRRVQRRDVVGIEAVDRLTDPPVADQLIGAESLARYEQALNRLDAKERRLIVARVELGQSYQEVAIEFGFANADSARKSVARALGRLATAMSS